MDRKPKKGFIKVLAGEQSKKNPEIEVLYYPPEYSMEKSNTFTEVGIPGLESPYLQYVKGNAGSITLEVFYDTYEEGKIIFTKQTYKHKKRQAINYQNRDSFVYFHFTLYSLNNQANKSDKNGYYEKIKRQ